MLTRSRIVIVGGSLAGTRALESARTRGYEGELVLIEAESIYPVADKPQLSKDFLAWDETLQPTTIAPAADVAVTVRSGSPATRLSLADAVVELESGERIGFDGLLIATGARARALPALAGLPNVHVVRTLDDSLRLRCALQTVPRPRVAVIGAGVLGCEIASTCAAGGSEVFMLDTASGPMQRVLGAQCSEYVLAEHHGHGVTTFFDVHTMTFAGDGRLERIEADAQSIGVDEVVVAVGSVPNIEWLADSGLALDGGVVTDEFGLTPGDGAPVAAAGDVAKSYHPHFRQPVRSEHWTNAVRQGQTVMRNLVSRVTGHTDLLVPFAEVPYAWSVQYGWMIQVAGTPADKMIVSEGDPADSRFVGTYWNEDQLTGVVAVNMQARMLKWRRSLADSMQKSIG